MMLNMIGFFIILFFYINVFRFTHNDFMMIP